MTNIEKVNKALVGADESKIKEVLDFLGYKENSKFIPKHGDMYWVITMVGTVDYNSWVNDHFDNYQLSSGNCYQNREEAEQALDFKTRKVKLIKEIEDSSDVIDWRDNDQSKYHFYFVSINDYIGVTYNRPIMHPGITYTTNKQFLEELIKERSDEVKELLFGIKL